MVLHALPKADLIDSWLQPGATREDGRVVLKRIGLKTGVNDIGFVTITFPAM